MDGFTKRLIETYKKYGMIGKIHELSRKIGSDFYLNLEEMIEYYNEQQEIEKELKNKKQEDDNV